MSWNCPASSYDIIIPPFRSGSARLCFFFFFFFFFNRRPIRGRSQNACLHNPPPVYQHATPATHVATPLGTSHSPNPQNKMTRNCKHHTSARVPHLHYKMPMRKVQFVVHVAGSDLLRRGLTARDRCKCIRAHMPQPVSRLPTVYRLYSRTKGQHALRTCSQDLATASYKDVRHLFFSLPPLLAEPRIVHPIVTALHESRKTHSHQFTHHKFPPPQPEEYVVAAIETALVRGIRRFVSVSICYQKFPGPTAWR